MFNLGRWLGLVVELWRVLEGLRLAKSTGFAAVELCVDSERDC